MIKNKIIIICFYYVSIFTGKIDFTDIHTDHCTISNKSNKLYLKARAESNSKVKVVKKAKVSHDHLGKY